MQSGFIRLRLRGALILGVALAGLGFSRRRELH